MTERVQWHLHELSFCHTHGDLCCTIQSCSSNCPASSRLHICNGTSSAVVTAFGRLCLCVYCSMSMETRLLEHLIQACLEHICNCTSYVYALAEVRLQHCSCDYAVAVTRLPQRVTLGFASVELKPRSFPCTYMSLVLLFVFFGCALCAQGSVSANVVGAEAGLF